MSKTQGIVICILLAIVGVMILATSAASQERQRQALAGKPVQNGWSEIAAHLTDLTKNINTVQDSQIELVKQQNEDKQTIVLLTKQVLDLTQEVKTLKFEVIKGINLIPTALRNEKPQPDAEKMAVIKVINDKLTAVATNAATKEDLEKLKTSVMQVLEEDKARKAEAPTVVAPATPSIVLPSLSEEFPKK